MLVNEYLVVSAFVFCTQVQYPGLELQMKIDITTMSFLSKSVALVREEFFFLQVYVCCTMLLSSYHVIGLWRVVLMIIEKVLVPAR